MKMLIVDDSKAMRGFLTHLATGMDFATTEAEDGRAALETLIRTEAKDRFDVALVDWEMPRMNGLEFVQFVRRHRAYDGLKLMMVTTSSSPEKVAAALAAGANDYLMKPVTRESLAEKLLILGLLS